MKIRLKLKKLLCVKRDSLNEVLYKVWIVLDILEIKKPKDVLVHEKVVFNAILYPALLKFLKKEMIQLLTVTITS